MLYIYAEAFNLLPHSWGRTLAGLNKTHIVLPSIESALKPGEQELLQTKSDTTVHLQEIDEAVREVVRIKDRTALDVTAVLDNLRQVDPTSTSIMHWATGISIFILLVIAFCCYYYRNFIIRIWRSCMLKRALKQKPFPRPRQRIANCNESISTLDTVLPLNVIAADPNMDREEEAETALDESSRVPTPFVSRGRLLVS
jgi:hypothetical protein